MHYLLRKQVVLLIIVSLFCASQIHAQTEIYRRYHDDLVYYFGLTLGYNTSTLTYFKSRAVYLQSDSIMSAEPGSSGGIAMGLMATARLSDHFQVRANPQLIIGGSKYIAYTLSKSKTRRSFVSKPDIAIYIGEFSHSAEIQFRQDR